MLTCVTICEKSYREPMCFDLHKARRTIGREFFTETKRVGLELGHGVVLD